MRKKGSDGSEGSVEPPNSPTAPVLSEEGEDWMHRRVREGMDEHRAREEALRQARYHSLGCPCEACS